MICAVSKSDVTVVVPACTVKLQGLVPVQPSPNPAKADLVPGVAASVSVEPGRNLAVQVPFRPGPVQLSPDGVEVTVPAPLPIIAIWTLPVRNAAVTVVIAVGGVNVHVPVPGQATPLQPPKTVLAPGVATSVTWDPGDTKTRHVPEPGAWQLRFEAGSVSTTPSPAPEVAISTTAKSNVAMNEVVPAGAVKVQGPVPEQSGFVQPVNAEPPIGNGVRVTDVPGTNCHEQVPLTPRIPGVL